MSVEVSQAVTQSVKHQSQQQTADIVKYIVKSKKKKNQYQDSKKKIKGKKSK